VERIGGTAAEQELVDKLKRGDRGAVERFFNDYFDTLYRFVFYRLGGDHHMTEEVIQEVLVSVMKNIGSYRGEASFHTWITTVAKNRLADHGRARAARRKLEVSLSAVDSALSSALSAIEKGGEVPAETAEKTELRELVRATLSSIPPAMQKLLRLRFIDGLTLDDLAREVGQSVGAVRNRLQVASRVFKTAFCTIGRDYVKE